MSFLSLTIALQGKCKAYRLGRSEAPRGSRMSTQEALMPVLGEESRRRWETCGGGFGVVQNGV